MKKKLLVVDDDLSLRQLLKIILEREGYKVDVASSTEKALKLIASELPDLILTDLNLPGASGMDLLREVKSKSDLPIIMITAYGSTESAVEAMKEGAFDYVTKPFNNDELRLLIRRALDDYELRKENLHLKQELKNKYFMGNMIGSSPAMKEVYQLIEQVKDTKISCLITGESGTGKELVARAIHYGGIRRNGPFIAINCGAIPSNLIESELFGYKKGAFTGAVKDKIGHFEAANGGTILLDEIGEMPLMAQVKTLRTIQERKVTPVGGIEEREIDVRILAATNRKLEHEIQANTFREDLYYRLNVITINVPPLNQRGEDVLELARHFLGTYAREYGKKVEGFTPEASKALLSWRFPGNVRELQNTIERAVALTDGERITISQLPEKMQPQISISTTDTPILAQGGMDLDAYLNEIERKYLVLALETAESKTQAAELLGMTFRSFRYRLSKHNLD